MLQEVQTTNVLKKNKFIKTLDFNSSTFYAPKKKIMNIIGEYISLLRQGRFEDTLASINVILVIFKGNVGIFCLFIPLSHLY